MSDWLLETNEAALTIRLSRAWLKKRKADADQHPSAQWQRLDVWLNCASLTGYGLAGAQLV